MAIAVNWITGVITVPKADTTLVQSTPNEIRTLDIDTFRLTLRDLEEDLAGRPWPRTHDHNTEVTVSGITLARVISILPPYTVTFEDGQYTVRLTGANSNIGDRLNANQVSVQSANSAGLINNAAPSDIWEHILEGTMTAEEMMRIFLAAMGNKLSGAETTNMLFRDLADSKNRINATVDANGNRSSVTLDGS